jgi:predicted DNA-binding transcriptional regulator YafY
MGSDFIGEKRSPTTKEGRQNRYLRTNGRIAEILRRLYAGEILSMRELAGEFGVSLRTIQRDVNERLVGFPVVKEGERFRLDWAGQEEGGFTPEENAVLELLDELSRKQGSAFYSRAHRLLEKARRLSAANPFYAKLDMEDIGEKLELAVRIEKAIRDRKILHCRYRMGEEHHEITIKPLKIANFEGYWYLIAQDARNDRVKKYLLRRIEAAEIGEESFEVPASLEEKVRDAVSVWFEPANDPFDVRLFIDREVARYFRLKPISRTQSIIGQDSDGSIEVLLRVTHEMEIVPIVKYWMPHLRVLEPAWLEERIRRDVEAWLEGRGR